MPNELGGIGASERATFERSDLSSLSPRCQSHRTLAVGIVELVTRVGHETERERRRVRDGGKKRAQKARVRKPSISLLTRTDDRLEERHSGPGRVGATCHGEESGTQGAAPVDVGRQTPRGAEVSVHVPE